MEILCLIEDVSICTFKHFSQCQVVDFWVPVLNVFVGVPGDAPP